ncbi:PKD domain-containing protein [Hydrogenophaga sp. 5NK40-0174]|uniref:PKD domain-containing protein n=1 Tax=Hydrogenophaga sp. 5NK40-0174 TaxID=3127649 RepID=UPI00310B1D46
MKSIVVNAWRWLAAACVLVLLAACEPIPVITYSPTTVYANEPVSFDGTETILSNYPSDNTVKTYRWSFGDGATARGSTVTHTYTSAGSYRVTLTVTDTAGREGSASENITVRIGSSSTTGSSTDSSNDDTSTSDDDSMDSEDDTDTSDDQDDLVLPK